MLEVLFEDLPEVEYPRFSVDERQHDHAERSLKSGVLVQSVQYDIRIDIFLQLDDDPGSFSVGLVSDSRDAFDPLVSYKVCHRLDEPCLVDLERNLGYDDPHPSVSVLLDLAYGSYEDFALTGEISFPCGLLSEDHCSCREVRSLDYIDKLVDVAVRLVDELDTCVDSLAEVVRRDRCRHTYGDTVRAVDQEVRYSGWEYYRLLLLAVVVVHEIDGVLLDVSDHLQRERRHPCFGVSRSSSPIAIDRAKVAVAVDKRIPRGEVLRHFDHGFVDGTVSVRMVLTHYLTDDTRRFLVRLVRCDAEGVHAVQDPPVYRLESVSDIRKSTADYDAHRIVDIRVLHLIVYLVFYDRAFFYLFFHFIFLY